MVMHEVYSEDETSSMEFLERGHFVTWVSVWGMYLLRRNLALISPCPDQQAQLRLRYALKTSGRHKKRT